MKLQFAALLAGMLLTLFFNSCQNEQSKKAAPNDIVEITNLPDERIYFECENVTQLNDSSPHYEVFIIIADNKTKVGDIEMCDVLPPEQYAQHQIPPEAIQAIGGLADDTYTFIYAIRDHWTGRILVKKGRHTEGQRDTSYNYRTILDFASQQLSANPKINPAQLVGAYGLDEGNHSYLFFVSMSKETLSAQLIELDRPLPAFDQIADALKEGGAIPEFLHGFDVNTQTLNFKAEHAKGKFVIPDNGPVTVVFEDRKDSKGSPLTLKKMN
ncbi:MAG TPA: hypothetical protein ENJ88_09780 [Phaeodactylibacter sp.]|nr:hypothetical protein [Phaeodactylibacter sp.]